ncbi:DUF429 domain-containing protein [Nocardioides sp. BGMRC 2183]|nr:DUF429 domain-containing protein [Nocardioides sp. BGMRC 2183]
MYFVGVDLAWGERRPTGVAVLDAEGHLVHVASLRGDDEIVADLTPYVDGPCLVAIDAPLIVRNPTGNRPAEALLNKDFGRFDAGAHPSNTGKPEFRDRPRGARLIGRLGLDMNPRSGRARRAIEVYPHPAMVVLFRLGRTLKYKNKSGRDLEQLRGELIMLLGLVEGLTGADPALHVDGEDGAWRRLRTAVETATRKVDLRAVEDQVDAVVCAYVAMFADRRPEATTTYGDLDSGYIVTPTLPADLTPTPRGAESGGAGDPGAAVRAYAGVHEELERAAEQCARLLTAVLDDAGINYLTVAGRAKSVASFAAKAARRDAGVLTYTDPLRDITDQIGLRVITYVHRDVQAVADLLADQAEVLDDRDLGRETASEGRFGYASRHLLLEIDPSRVGEPLEPVLQGRPVQVQIRTVLQHAWAEFEHDIRYKGTIPTEQAADFDRRFTLAAGLLELADREFSTIRDRIQQQGVEPEPAADDDPRLTPRELAAFLAGQYADAGWSRTDHYQWIARIVLELGIGSLAELGETLRAVDTETLMERMDYRYPPGAVRRLDDALLWAYGDAYVELAGNAHRAPALRTRLAKMRGEG